MFGRISKSVVTNTISPAWRSFDCLYLNMADRLSLLLLHERKKLTDFIQITGQLAKVIALSSGFARMRGDSLDT